MTGSGGGRRLGVTDSLDAPLWPPAMAAGAAGGATSLPALVLKGA